MDYPSSNAFPYDSLQNYTDPRDILGTKTPARDIYFVTLGNSLPIIHNSVTGVSHRIYYVWAAPHPLPNP